MRNTTRHWLYVGGYGTNIEAFQFHPDSGSLTPTGLTEGVPDSPTFITVDQSTKRLFAISEKGGPDTPQPGRATAFDIDAASGRLSLINEVGAGGSNAVFVAVSRSGRHILTASSSSVAGTAAVLPVAGDGKLSEPSDVVIAGKNAHGLAQSPDGNLVWVSCRGDETVAQYRFDEAAGKLHPLVPPNVALPGPAGPRHVAAHPSKRVVYILGDWSGEIFIYSYGDDGVLVAKKSVSVFPADKQPIAAAGTMTAAELEVSADGKYVYATTRSAALQSIAVLAVASDGDLTLVANEEAGGSIKGPRHFVITPERDHLILANQDTNTLLVFKIDPDNGQLTLVGDIVATKIKMPNALAVASFQ